MLSISAVVPNAAAMLDHNLPNLVGVLVGITALRSVAPLSALYTLWNIYSFVVNGRKAQHLSTILLQVYCLTETLFLIFFLGYRVYLQAEAVHPPLRSKADRQALFEKVQSEMNDPEQFISGWFRGAKVEDIGRDELKNFMNWSFWEGRATEEDEEELNEYVRRSEQMAGIELKEHGTAKPLRLTLDPISMEYRSLFWYFLIFLLDTVASLGLYQHGFQYYRTSYHSPWIFPPRSATAFTNKCSPSPQLSYWFRHHTSKTRLPVLFLHGVGIGLQAYVEFLHLLDVALNKDAGPDDKVGILALEFMPISSRLCGPVPGREEFNRQVLEILDKHNFQQVVLVNHSYGSIASSHILTDDVVSARVSAVLTVDPVSILLSAPTVCYNFTVRQPRTASEWQLYYFASKDPGISHTLGRHLFWYESVLWRDRIVELVSRGMKFTASLSRRDLIVDTPAVARYLLKNDKPDPVVSGGGKGGARKTMQLESSQDNTSDEWKTRPWKGSGLEVLWWEDFDHAQVMDYPDSTAKLISVICEYCKGDKKDS